MDEMEKTGGMGGILRGAYRGSKALLKGNITQAKAYGRATKNIAKKDVATLPSKAKNIVGDLKHKNFLRKAQNIQNKAIASKVPVKNVAPTRVSAAVKPTVETGRKYLASAKKIC